MSTAQGLPIYRSAQRLVSHLHDATRKAPRDLRHTLVQRLLDAAVECGVSVVSANRASGTDRIRHIETLREQAARAEILLQVALEQRCISRGATATAMEHLDEIGRQSAGWLRSTTASLSTPVTAASQS